jgi:hypothetical protein
LNLFINSLDNILSEEIQQIDPTISSKEDFKKLYINNKVNKVCDILRKELFKQDDER